MCCKYQKLSYLSGVIKTTTMKKGVIALGPGIEINIEKFEKNTQVEWERIAKEPVRVEYIKGAMYGFCSELAALRLEHKYRNNNKAFAAFSMPQTSWYFCLETDFR